MAYGILTPDMTRAIEAHVKGRVVWDLGAGDLTHSRALLTMGASQVIAVDRAFGKDPKAPGIVLRGEYFADSARRLGDEKPEVAFLAWPCNWAAPGLDSILDASPVVIYLGCNTGGSSCGTPDLFMGLIRREILAEVRDPRNDLIIYGRQTGSRDLRPEERAAFSSDILAWSPTD